MLDAVERHVHDALDALPGGLDGEDVTRATKAAVGVLVAVPRGDRGVGQVLHRDDVGAVLHLVERRCHGQVNHVLVDPAALGDVLERVAEHHAEVNHVGTLGDVGEGDLVRLRYLSHGDDAVERLGAGLEVAYRDGDVVLGFDLDAESSSRPIASFRMVRDACVPAWPRAPGALAPPPALPRAPCGLDVRGRPGEGACPEYQ